VCFTILHTSWFWCLYITSKNTVANPVTPLTSHFMELENRFSCISFKIYHIEKCFKYKLKILKVAHNWFRGASATCLFAGNSFYIHVIY
jgi:hypothetical protein